MKFNLKYLIILIVLGVAGFYGYKYTSLYLSKDKAKTDIIHMLAITEGLIEPTYTFKMVSYTKAEGIEQAKLNVTCLKESLSWDVECVKVGFPNDPNTKWAYIPEQNELDDIKAAVGGLMQGARIGEFVVNNKSDMNNARELIRVFNIKHPKSRIKQL